MRVIHLNIPAEDVPDFGESFWPVEEFEKEIIFADKIKVITPAVPTTCAVRIMGFNVIYGVIIT